MYKEKDIGKYTICLNGSDWTYIIIRVLFDKDMMLEITKRYSTEETGLSDYNWLKTEVDVARYLLNRPDLQAIFKVR